MRVPDEAPKMPFEGQSGGDDDRTAPGNPEPDRDRIGNAEEDLDRLGK
jgi:hypothetical protein